MTTVRTPSKILAIIPCLNEEDYLAGLVHDLIRDAAESSLSLQIAIVDGGSTDNTVKIAQKLSDEYPQLHLLHNKARIQSAAINLAVEQLGDNAEFLVRIDAHAGYPKGFCADLLSDQQTTGADSIVVSMDTIGKSSFQKAVAAAQNSKLGNGGSAHRNASKDGGWVEHGHHALMRITSFRAVRGYDETFSHNEDAELDLRLREAGFKIWLTGKTKILYYPRSAALPLFWQYFNFGKGRARTILKHKARPHLRQMAPTVVAPAAILALASPFFGIASLPILLWAIICLAYGMKMALAKKDHTLAASGPAIMLMHLGWSLGFWRGISGQLLKQKAAS